MPVAEYHVEDKYTYQARHLRVVVIGAGISGIYMGIRIPQVLENIDLVIYEKNSGVSGTWFENKYPGCACDVPSHRYTYTFEPNPDWPSYYSDTDSIEKYYEGIAEKYQVLQYVRLNHAVTAAKWDEESANWKLSIDRPEGSFDDTCDVLINASGVLNKWKWPDIPGLNDFKGKLLHTAHYDRSVPLEGKRVAVIGSGSSGIQVVATIQKRVAHLGVYIRSPTWIVPPFNMDKAPRHPDGTPDYRYSEAERKRFREDPQYFAKHRMELEAGSTRLFQLLVKGTAYQELIRETLTRNMSAILDARPGLAEKMIPKFAVGCRRITPGTGFLEALVKDNVEPIFGNIDRFTEKGIVSEDGTEVDYDVIICATGFDVSFGARFPFVGRDGRQMDHAYAEDPKSYLSLAIGGFPNHFIFNGPSSPIGNGSVVPAIETEGEYMIQCIRKIQTEDIKTMCIKDEAVEEFVCHVDTYMPRMVWTDNCRSWYKNGKVNGRVTALWPGSAYNFIKVITTPRYEDYNYTYTNPLSRFSFLGTGKSKEEVESDDISGYLETRMVLTDGHPALKLLAAATL
ncbi:FAD/NAD(P)-binding domain-containing protein [Calocera viscosa TUFC12733]|uniref:FAD/NAD(P)-binding domain-containing protein n=1 Tax=Calocera viscosa (strain TUFC12733) TaxID=1330018 RepID=A0A167FS71_CALVF|nr:FAD/NAD(P)-binding domain-containing protein [Calocera viscosa TUFC12733]